MPACTYKLKNEHHYSSHTIYHRRNDSLKRVLQRVLGEDDEVPGHSSEHIDSGPVNDDFYLTREYVDQWADEAFESLMATEPQVCFN